MKKYNIFDLFSGVGGLSYGFDLLPEFNVVAANEIEKDIATAYSLNYPDVKMFNCDIAELNETNLSSITSKSPIDVVIGGPPCQSYSTLGKRQMDKRARLFVEYKRILNILRPKAFVFENVEGLLSVEHGQLYKKIQQEFYEIGYDLIWKLLDAAEYGVPQHRKRIFLVGFLGKNNYVYPLPSHEGNSDYVTLRDALSDLPSIKSGGQGSIYAKPPINDFLKFVRKNGATVLTEHIAPKNGKHLIEIMETLEDGQSKDDLPEAIRPKSGYKNTYAKLWWDRPSTTITRNFACPSSSRCIHPRDSRAMSIREGARLQSFPDDYKFYGSDGMKRLEIGNAVPPLLSIAIAREVLRALEEKEVGK